MVIKTKRVTNPEKLFNYMKYKPAMTKKQLSKKTGFKMGSIHRSLRILRRKGLVGFKYRKYWGVN